MKGGERGRHTGRSEEGLNTREEGKSGVWKVGKSE